MDILNKIWSVAKHKPLYAIAFVVALITFVYITDWNLIGGLLTAFFVLVIYITGAELVSEYKKLPKSKPATAKKPSAKKATKKAKK
ncbi:MAG: hypothetical protein IKZ49_01525 [Alphaproteobacteria bacterium]|nr:hypothetical protein [Alphaproteobacteria bacterium]